MAKFNKGLNRDTDPLDQPEGSYRYAKNVVIEPNSGSIQFERGTGNAVSLAGAYNPDTSTVALTTGYNIVGTIVLQDDTVVMFSVYPNSTTYTSPGTSEVGLYDPTTSTYTTVYNDYAQPLDGQLNFRKEYPIQGEFKIDGTGRVSIYWTDDNEVMRYMRLYNPPTTGTAFDMESLNIFPLFSTAPAPIFNKIVSGTLGSGVYALTIALVNDEGTPTNYVNLSNWVKVSDDAEGNASVEISELNVSPSSFVNGSLPQHSQMDYNGCLPDTATGKGVSWIVNNLDPRYSFIRPAIIYRIGGVVQVVQLQDVDYDTALSTSKIINFTGTETAESILLTDVLIARESYVQAKTVAQVDDILYWGNLVKSKIDINYQPYANNIEIEAVFANSDFLPTNTVNGVSVDFEPSLGAGRTAEFQYFHKGYQRDETYAFYISWMMADGNETVAYHIPGREKLSIQNYAGSIGANPATEATMASATNYNIPCRDAGTSGMGLVAPYNQQTAQYEALSGGDIALFKASTYGATLGGSNGMGYWENATENYPLDVNYEVPLNADGSLSSKSSLGGTKVRHHHFPSAITGENGAGGDGGHIWHKAGNGHGRFQKPVINPLGFRAKNIPIPKSMEGKVIGYKLHYAKRDEANTTVLDTGIFNGTPSFHGGPKGGKWGADPTSGHGDSAANPQLTLSEPKNGYEMWGYTSNCHDSVVNYAVQKPPGGNDYTGTGLLGTTEPMPNYQGPGTGNNGPTSDVSEKGHVVCTPFSAMHAPYSNAGYDRFDLDCYIKDTYYNLTLTPRANHFTFNGLHSHINRPDTSNASFVKLQRHIRIGGNGANNAVDLNRMLGSALIRHDDQQNAIRARSKMSSFFNWTILPPVDYAATGKLNGSQISGYGIDPVTGSANQPPAGIQFGNFRAIKADTFRFIQADTNVDVSGSSSDQIINYGGCQTFYLQTVNNISVFDYSKWIRLFHGNFVQRAMSATTGSGMGFNYISWKLEEHNFMINKYDETSSYGSWGFQHAAIGDPNFNGATSSYRRSWTDGWFGALGGTWTSAYFPCKGYSSGNSANPAMFYGITNANEQLHVIQYAAYGGVHRKIEDLYDTFDTQQSLVYTGYSNDITGLVIPTSGLMYNPTDVIFGGDTYIGYYCETRSMKGEGPSMNGLGGGGPNYCTGVNSNNNPHGASQNISTCCNPGVDLCHNSSCDNLSAAWEIGQGQNMYANGNRYGHYAYGVMGDVHGAESTDITQQLYITESKVNMVERHTGGDINENFYPAVNRQDADLNTWNSGPRLFTYDLTMQSLMDIYPSVAFNHLNKVSSQTDFPTRIIRSVRYNQSGLMDNFRTYLPGQYRDLPRNRGELWNLSVYDNVLLPQLERALMKTKGKESLETGGGIGDVSMIALGDGDLFKSDPNEILYTERGYAGTLSQWSVCTSRYGHLSIDKKTGKIFLLSDKLEEISSYGMRKFFAKRLRAWALEGYGIPYNIDMPTLNIGIIATFDPEHARYVITKLDKKPTTLFKQYYNLTAGSNNKITWNSSIKLYQKYNSSTLLNTPIEFDNLAYFADISWTASYYPALKLWGSLHDYSPRLYFYTTNKLYSIIGSSSQSVWEHGYATGTTDATATYNISQYYGNNYDVIFEYIDNISPLDNKLYFNISYEVDVDSPTDQEVGSRHAFQDSGFTHYNVYNSRQASQELPLVEPEGTNNNLWSTATVRRKERSWYAKGFRDDRQQVIVSGSVTDAPIDTAILTSDYLTADINMNVAALDTLTLLWNQRRKMVDKWMAIRLICRSAYTVGASTGKKLVTLHSATAGKRKTSR
jgi:hypothetical protein